VRAYRLLELRNRMPRLRHRLHLIAVATRHRPVDTCLGGIVIEAGS
jgi:hypothetical protein